MFVKEAFKEVKYEHLSLEKSNTFKMNKIRPRCISSTKNMIFIGTKNSNVLVIDK